MHRTEKGNAFLKVAHALLFSSPTLSLTDLCQGLEEVSLVSERVVDQSIAEGHDAMREVVLRQPSHHPLLLHIWTSSHIDDQIA